MVQGTLSLFAGAVVLGLVHGAEPGHGWPIAATYELDRGHRWLAGLTAAVVIGVGHLVSSIAVVAAFFLGFAHEKEFEILGFCTGATQHCLDLMLAYAFAVILALVAPTLLMVAGYQCYEKRLERYAKHFPTISAAVLVLMGLGFIAGVL